jgi:hypothetical protein
VDYVGGHRRPPNGILGLLCREHFPGLVEYAGVTGPAFTFDHYAVAPDAVDRDGREFNNKAERVKQELWVSLSIMLSTFRTREDPQPTSEFVATCPCPDGLMQDGTQERE